MDIGISQEQLSDKQISDKQKWLFKENIRLEELGKALEDERKLIEIQKGMLERQQSKNMLLSKQLQNQKICLTASGRYWSGKCASLP